jgi:hypothetical protein
MLAELLAAAIDLIVAFVAGDAPQDEKEGRHPRPGRSD